MADENSHPRAADVVHQLLGEREALAADVIGAILREIPEFTDDARLVDLLKAAATENVSALMHAIALGTEMAEIDAPATGVEHARILAQRDIPITVLLRAYRLGQTRFMEGVIERAKARGLGAEIALELVHGTSLYIDRVSNQVARAYETEREMRLGGKVALRQHWVNRLLSPGTHDIVRAEAALGYPLGGWHVAIEAWVGSDSDAAVAVGQLDRASALLARFLPSRGGALCVPLEANHVRLWLPVAESFAVDTEVLAAELAGIKSPVRMAIGDRRRGVDGFRATAATAAKVRSLAMSGGNHTPPVLAYRDVVPVILVTDDEAEKEKFIVDTLGELGERDPRRDELRETLLTFLECNRSYNAAAAKLHVHRNTVHYRVQQAVKQANADLDEDSFALQFALTICRWQDRS